MAFLFRRPGPLLVLGSSILGGAAYQFAVAPPASESLNPHTFTPYTLVDKKTVSTTSAIFTLRNREDTDPESIKEAWKRGVWSVQVKQPQLQIARAYTPLPSTSDTASGNQQERDVRMLVRQEEKGEMSTYLHRLPEQSTIELRGPYIECELPEDINEVIFLAGGTGIAPAMQVAHVMGQRTGSKMDILWANRRREDCVGGVSNSSSINTTQPQLSWWKSLLGFATPDVQALIREPHHSQDRGLMVQELEALKAKNAAKSSDLAVDYYVDEEKTLIKPKDVIKRLEPSTTERKGAKVIFVSGPDGFIEYWAGKKLWIGGREEQGPLGGVLGRTDLKGWKVFKL